MRIDWNIALRMNDGALSRADVFRPIGDGQYPVILTYGCYAKGLAYQEGYAAQWSKMVADHPEILEGSTNKYQSWEVADPERWVPHGYALVRVDSRGAGWSEGVFDPFQPAETDDAVQWIEWAGVQPWSNGKVGMVGISYYSVMQWRIAERHPSHLAAIIPWEGFQRLLSRLPASRRHSIGIRQTLGGDTVRRPCNTASAIGRSGTPLRVCRSPAPSHWLPTSSPETSETPGRKRLGDPCATNGTAHARPIFPKSRCPCCPVPTGAARASIRAAISTAISKHPPSEKWLEVHGDSHWSLFSASYGLNLQRRFFDCYSARYRQRLEKNPAVTLNVRHPGEKFVLRHETNGRWRARSGPSFISIRLTKH